MEITFIEKLILKNIYMNIMTINCNFQLINLFSLIEFPNFLKKVLLILTVNFVPKKNNLILK